MSSRAEHFHKAEELLEQAGRPGGERAANFLVSQAAVHAILASVAWWVDEEGPDE